MYLDSTQTMPLALILLLRNLGIISTIYSSHLTGRVLQERDVNTSSPERLHASNILKLDADLLFRHREAHPGPVMDTD